MSTIEVAVAGRGIQVKQGYEKPSAGDVNTCEVSLEIESGGVWDSLPHKRVTFATRTASVTVDYAPTIAIPHEVMASPGALYLTLTGYDADGIEVARTHRMTYPIEVARAGADEGAEPTPATLDVVSRIDALAADLEEKRDTDYWRGEPGKDGAPGEPGADGYSPTANVTKVGSTATITVIDKNGTTTATVSDGAPGKDGSDATATDVRIAGKSITADGVADIPAAANSSGIHGVVKLGEYSSGLRINRLGELAVVDANNSAIDKRSGGSYPITTNGFDYAVKAAMCDGNGAAWTDGEKKAARERMNAADVNKVYIMQKQIENLQGIAATEETDSTEAYTKTVPTGAQKWASLDKVGGKTVINAGELVSAEVVEVESRGKNLLNITASFPYTASGFTYTRDGNAITASGTATSWPFMVLGEFKANGGENVCLSFTRDSTEIAARLVEKGTTNIIRADIDGTFVIPKDMTVRVDIEIASNTSSGTFTIRDIQIEKGTKVTKYKPYLEPVSFPIPDEVRDMCPGYGWSAGTVCNEIDFGRKVYVQRVESLIIGEQSSIGSDSGLWPTHSLYLYPNAMNAARRTGINNNVSVAYQFTSRYLNNSGAFVFFTPVEYNNVSEVKDELGDVLVYYELAEPIEVDLSSVLPDDHYIEVEAGGTVTFKQASTQLPVPSSVTYQISTKEVVANA